jgi:hypothetical protein
MNNISGIQLNEHNLDMNFALETMDMYGSYN